MKINKRSATIGGLTGLLAGTLGVAAATIGGVWTASTNTGSGYGQAIQMTVSTSSASTDADNSVANHATNGLYPGVSGAPLYVKVSNPNPFSIDVTGISSVATATVTSGAPTDCPASNVTPAAASLTPSVGTKTIAAGGTAVYAVTGALSMSGSAPNLCQGVAFNVDSVTVNATQSVS
jgi:hypothetical protein